MSEPNAETNTESDATSQLLLPLQCSESSLVVPEQSTLTSEFVKSSVTSLDEVEFEPSFEAMMSNQFCRHFSSAPAVEESFSSELVAAGSFLRKPDTDGSSSFQPVAEEIFSDQQVANEFQLSFEAVTSNQFARTLLANMLQKKVLLMGKPCQVTELCRTK